MTHFHLLVLLCPRGGGVGGADGRGSEAVARLGMQQREHLEGLLLRVPDPAPQDSSLTTESLISIILRPVALSLCFRSKYLPLLVGQSLSLP